MDHTWSNDFIGGSGTFESPDTPHYGASWGSARAQHTHLYRKAPSFPNALFLDLVQSPARYPSRGQDLYLG